MKNKPTKRLTITEKRVVVAKDALKQLKAERFVAQIGHYLGMDITQALEEVEDRTCQAQPYLKDAKVCTVCAKGALLLSAIRKFNKATIRDVLNEDMSKPEKLFGEHNLDNMEAAFETWDCFSGSRYGQPVPVKVEQFGHNYDNAHDRLVAILKNVIKNNGTFKP